VNSSVRNPKLVVLLLSCGQFKANVYVFLRVERYISTIKLHGCSARCESLIKITLSMMCRDWRMMTYLLSYVSVLTGNNLICFSQKGVKRLLHPTNDATKSSSCEGSYISHSQS
jgi:hypothetical protein